MFFLAVFLLCTAVPYGNGFVGSSAYDETLKQVQGDVLKRAKAKIKACFSQAFMRGIGSFMEWSFYGME